jgi:ribulose bisphosphate carboxylase small subunit
MMCRNYQVQYLLPQRQRIYSYHHPHRRPRHHHLSADRVDIYKNEIQFHTVSSVLLQLHMFSQQHIEILHI